MISGKAKREMTIMNVVIVQSVPVHTHYKQTISKEADLQ